MFIRLLTKYSEIINSKKEPFVHILNIINKVSVLIVELVKCQGVQDWQNIPSLLLCPPVTRETRHAPIVGGDPLSVQQLPFSNLVNFAIWRLNPQLTVRMESDKGMRWFMNRTRDERYGNILRTAEVYLENGPLDGQTRALNDVLGMNFEGGFYMRNESQPVIALKQKQPCFSWIGAKDRKAVVLIGDDAEDVTIESARIDKQAEMHLRLRKDGVETKLYEFWRGVAEERKPVCVILNCDRYCGRAELVGRNEADGYIFLQFLGRRIDPLPQCEKPEMTPDVKKDRL